MTQLEYFRDRVIPDWELTPPEVTLNRSGFRGG